MDEAVLCPTPPAIAGTMLAQYFLIVQALGSVASEITGVKGGTYQEVFYYIAKESTRRRVPRPLDPKYGPTPAARLPATSK